MIRSCIFLVGGKLERKRDKIDGEKCVGLRWFPRKVVRGEGKRKKEGSEAN